MNHSALLDATMTTQQQYAEPPSAQPGVVYVIDDEIQVLEVIAMQLRAAQFNVVTFNQATEFLAAVDDLGPGVVISDQRMPDMEGLQLQRSLQPLAHKFQVIILSGYPETRVAVEAMRQGAVTVLDKPYNKEQLVNAIREAFDALEQAGDDGQGLPPILPDGAKYLDRLSTRERQVIDLVYEGATNKSIGISLGISIKTVEKHRGKAMKKMEVNSLAELIRLVNRELGRK